MPSALRSTPRTASPGGVVRVAPLFGPEEDVVVRGIPLGTGTLSLRISGGVVEILEAPANVQVDVQR